MENLFKLIFLTIIKKNEKNVVSIYDTFSKLMQITTGGNMLNFGYWDSDTPDPLKAQQKLTSIIGKFSNLENVKNVIDIGSGFSDPAFQWIKEYEFLKILCININLNQLNTASKIYKKIKENHIKEIQFLNSTSTNLPIRKQSYELIIAFESAQHFKPLVKFINESNRILQNNGHLILAIPVVTFPIKLGMLSQILKLGILYITWASEHYYNKDLICMIEQNGFSIQKIRYMGSNVYLPLAEYYLTNREEIKKKIIKSFPSFVEKILFRSIKKMKSASANGIIEYVLIDAKKKV